MREHLVHIGVAVRRDERPRGSAGEKKGNWEGDGTRELTMELTAVKTVSEAPRNGPRRELPVN